MEGDVPLARPGAAARKTLSGSTESCASIVLREVRMSREAVQAYERISRLQALKNTTSSRREFLNRAAALGLIPVLSGGSGLAPFGSALAGQENSPVQGGTFVTLGHQE